MQTSLCYTHKGKALGRRGLLDGIGRGGQYLLKVCSRLAGDTAAVLMLELQVKKRMCMASLHITECIKPERSSRNVFSTASRASEKRARIPLSKAGSSSDRGLVDPYNEDITVEKLWVSSLQLLIPPCRVQVVIQAI